MADLERITTSQLLAPELSVAFYEERYAAGYMDAWPADKLERVSEVIRAAQLPVSGKALDFGCGTGVFTELIAGLLPGWEVYGADISQNAIDKAQERVPNARFFLLGDPEFDSLRVDFAFSHHVLEHVPDLGTARKDLLNFLAPHARMLHILPCGNQGSLMHTLCALRTGGIERESGNRFYLDEPAHVRRLTTSDMERLFEDFSLTHAYYTGQRWGTIDYVTRIEPALVQDIDPGKAVDARAAGRLALIRGALRLVVAASGLVQKYEAKAGVRPLTIRNAAVLTAAAVPYLAARGIQNYVTRKADAEWSARQGDPRGDQMFLVFQR